jgi:transposase
MVRFFHRHGWRITMNLTNAQWEIVGPLIPEPPRRPDGRGRPWRAAREVLDGILWILRTGTPWHDLPDRYPPYQTCHRRFQQWVRSRVFDTILHALATDLAECGGLDFSECFIDGTFVGAKKGALALAKPSAGRAPRSWRSQMALVFQSQSTWQALRRMKSPWLSQRWLHASQIRPRTAHR